MAENTQKKKKTTAQRKVASRSERLAALLKRKPPAVRDWKEWKKWKPLPLLPPTKLKPLTADELFIYSRGKDPYQTPNLFDTLWEGIKTGWNAFTGSLSSLANSIGGLFSGSNSSADSTSTSPTGSNVAPQPVNSTSPPAGNAQAYSLPPVMNSQPPSASSATLQPSVGSQVAPTSATPVQPSVSSLTPPASYTPTSGQPTTTNTVNTGLASTSASGQVPSLSSSSQTTATTVQPPPATGSQTYSANTNVQPPPASSPPYLASNSQTAPVNTNQQAPSSTTNQTQTTNTNTSFTQSGNQTYPTSGSQQQHYYGTPTTNNPRSRKSPSFWDQLYSLGNAAATIVTAPIKAISGETSSPQLPATMDEYYARRRATEQTVYGNVSDDYNPYGGIDYVNVPYLSQDEIVASEDLAGDVGKNVLTLAPIIEGKLRRLNPYASDEDIMERTKNAIGSIYTLALTHAQNQRARHELLKAVAEGQTSNFTPEQIQQLQQLGIIDKNGQLVPGAHAAAQASLSGTFDDDKNQYPTVFTIASSARPSEYNRQAIADRSARTGVLDTSVFGPDFTPMYGATPPPPVAGVNAHTSRQGSLSAGLSQPQQINISTPHSPSGGSKKTTLSVSPVKFNFSITNDRVDTDLHPNKMSAGEESPILISAHLVHRKRNVLSDILFGSWEFTHGANSPIPYTKQNIQNIADRISNNSYQDRGSVEADLDILSKFVGANGWKDLRHKLINANFAININAINNFSNFLTQSLSGSSQLSTDERILMELRNELADVFKDPSQAATKFQNYFTQLRTEAQYDDKRAAKALYKLIMIAGYDNGFSKVLISDNGALAMQGGRDLQQANTKIASSLKSAWANIFDQNTIQYLYDTQNQWSKNYGGVHARDVALGVIANAIMRWYDKLPDAPPPQVK